MSAQHPTTITATPANMRQYAVPGLMAYSQSTGEQCSATAGDYFWMPDDEALVDSEGTPMILAVSLVSTEPITS